MKQSCMKDLNAVLSPLKISGSLICTIRVFVAGAIVTGAGVAGCFKVLIFSFGADRLGCSSSLLISSLLLSVSYSLLLGVTVFLGSILNAVTGLDSLLVGLYSFVVLVTVSLWTCPVEVAGAV